MRSMRERLITLLGSRVDGASLAAFRIAFGAVMLWEAYRLLGPFGNTTRLAFFFTSPGVTWNLPYHGFEWLVVWPEPWMTVHCWALGIASAMLMCGLFSRLSAAVVCFTWTYLFLLDETRFNNHYYLQSLIAFLLIWMSSAECFSLDRFLRAAFGRSKANPPGSVPFWMIFLLRSQLMVMYVYGGIAKLNADWLLDAQPIRLALNRAAENIGDPFSPEKFDSLRTVMNNAAVGYTMAYSGMLFDLGIGFLLLVRRTRLPGLLLLVAFHGLNHFLIFQDIATFPAFGMAASLIFLDPDWPRRLARLVSAPLLRLVGRGGKVVGTIDEQPALSPQPSRLVVVFVCAWLGVQLIVPLRYLFIPGNVNWTCEGGRFAWRMKGTARASDSLRMLISDPAIIHLDDAGKVVVDPQLWTGSPVVYRQINTEDVDWSKLPEIVVVFQPLYGEVIYYNRFAGGHAASIKRARWRIERLWQERYDRQPEVMETRSLSAAIDDASTEAVAISDGIRWIRSLDRLKQLAEIVEDRSLPPHKLWRTFGEMRVNLNRVVASRQVGGMVRQEISSTHPFALEGSSEKLPFLIIKDPQLHGVRDDGLVSIDREVWLGTNEVYLDADHPDRLEWPSLPRVFLTIDVLDRAGLAWNQLHDLTPNQAKSMATYPFMVHQYVNQVAQKWQQEHGRYPQIYVVDHVRLNHHPRQLLVDPRIDLAAAGLKLFGHNDWITPFNRNPSSSGR